MQSDYEFFFIPRKVISGDGWLEIVQPSMSATLTTSFQPYSAQAKQSENSESFLKKMIIRYAL